MNRLSQTLLPVVVLATAVAGCDGGAGEVHPPAGDMFAESGVEITLSMSLDQLEGLYRDRERLAGPGGAALAATWGGGMSLDEANEHADELIAFWAVTLFVQLASGEDTLPTRAGFVRTIAEYAGVETDEVEADVDRAYLDPLAREVLER